MWCVEAKAKIDIPLKSAKGYFHGNVKEEIDVTIPVGQVITITHGINEKYALWGHGYIWDLPESYVGEIVKVISPS